MRKSSYIYFRCFRWHIWRIWIFGCFCINFSGHWFFSSTNIGLYFMDRCICWRYWRWLCRFL